MGRREYDAYGTTADTIYSIFQRMSGVEMKGRGQRARDGYYIDFKLEWPGPAPADLPSARRNPGAMNSAFVVGPNGRVEEAHLRLPPIDSQSNYDAYPERSPRRKFSPAFDSPQHVQEALEKVVHQASDDYGQALARENPPAIIPHIGFGTTEGGEVRGPQAVARDMASTWRQYRNAVLNGDFGVVTPSSSV